MAKISNPLLFSEHFGIDPKKLEILGVFNPLLNIDTKLFIDPLLLKKSAHSEMSTGAVNTYQKHFHAIIKLLQSSKQEHDLPWRNAERYFMFREIKGTCLGYGAASIHGSAWGPELQKQVFYTAKEIINLGIDDPSLFVVLALFEKGVGPDRISDMVTNVILKDLVDFNSRIIKELNLPVENFHMNGIAMMLPRNPCDPGLPIILVPCDVLRHLPIAKDWAAVKEAASKNQQLRLEVSQQIGEIWEAGVQKEKEELKRRVLASKSAFTVLLKSVRAVKETHYDFIADKAGEVTWMHLLENKGHVLSNYPLELSLAQNPTLEDVFVIVQKIVEQFRKLIEEKGLWRDLWSGDKRRGEKSAQRIFFAVADTYCKGCNLDLTPEADSGAGPVDFKFSFGYKNRVLVEIKLSSNSHLVSGYEKQLEIYKVAEQTTKAIYLVIDVGQMGEKDKRIIDIKNRVSAEGDLASEIVFVDGNKKLSASKQ